MAGYYLEQTLRKLIVPILGLFAGCSVADHAVDVFQKRLAATCSTLAVGDELRLGSINTEDWDAFFLFPPYTTVATIEKAIKQKLPSSIARSGIGERDDINLFVFLNGQTVQMVAVVPRKTFDASVPNDHQPLDRGSAIFVKSTVGSAFALKAPTRRE
jgi:hypothetical protein